MSPNRPANGAPRRSSLPTGGRRSWLPRGGRSRSSRFNELHPACALMNPLPRLPNLSKSRPSIVSTARVWQIRCRPTPPCSALVVFTTSTVCSACRCLRLSPRVDDSTSGLRPRTDPGVRAVSTFPPFDRRSGFPDSHDWGPSECSPRRPPGSVTAPPLPSRRLSFTHPTRRVSASRDGWVAVSRPRPQGFCRPSSPLSSPASPRAPTRCSPGLPPLQGTLRSVPMSAGGRSPEPVEHRICDILDRSLGLDTPHLRPALPNPVHPSVHAVPACPAAHARSPDPNDHRH